MRVGYFVLGVTPLLLVLRVGSPAFAASCGTTTDTCGPPRNCTKTTLISTTEICTDMPEGGYSQYCCYTQEKWNIQAGSCTGCNWCTIRTPCFASSKPGNCSVN